MRRTHASIDRVIFRRMPGAVLLLPKAGYRNDDFLAAAQKLGVEVVPVSDVCHQLAAGWEDSPLAVKFREAGAAAEELARAVAPLGPAAGGGVGDLTPRGCGPGGEGPG